MIETLLSLEGVLKDFYIPSDARQVKDLVVTSKRPARRGVLSFIPEDRDEVRIRRLLSRVRKLRMLAKQIAEVE